MEIYTKCKKKNYLAKKEKCLRKVYSKTDLEEFQNIYRVKRQNTINNKPKDIFEVGITEIFQKMGLIQKFQEKIELGR